MDLPTGMSKESQFLNAQVLSYGKILVDTNCCKVTYDGQIVTLLPKEYNLLVLFLKYPNHVLSYEVIIDRLWNFNKCPTQSNIRSHIKGLRKAFNKIDASAKVIETVHGLGYRLSPVEKSNLTNAIITPSFSVVQNFFKAKAVEYIVINDELLIQYISPNLSNYCDYPELLKIGDKLEYAFPEFVGFEQVFKKIINKEYNNFEIKGIARAVSQNRPEYINLYVMVDDIKKSEKQEEKNIFIFFEDVSETMIYRQRLVQMERELYLRLEMERNS